MIENNFYTAQTQGPYVTASIGRLDLEEGGVIEDCWLAYATAGTLNEAIESDPGFACGEYSSHTQVADGLRRQAHLWAVMGLPIAGTVGVRSSPERVVAA